MDFVVGIGVVLIGALAIYSLGHYLCLLTFALSPWPRKIRRSSQGAVTVLIPARNEGANALHAIRSVLDQDHAGAIDVWLLVRDEDDSTLPLLRAALGFDGDEVETEPGRRLRLVKGGLDPKAAKVRAALQEIETPFTAILDADHIAQRPWISSALAHLAHAQEQGRPVRAVQCRRYPIAARGFFRFWDSLHQHVGCEVFNLAFTRLGLNVFFTGTTALFETELLRSRPMRDVVTEDIDLSYDLFLSGEWMVSDPHHGSAEQLSPDLYSFLARRRRWANGHSEAFFRHLPSLLRAPLPWRAKLQYLFHGTHYLWALAILLLHLWAAYFVAPRLSWTTLGCAGASAAFLALVVMSSQRTRGWPHRLLEWAVACVWFFPALVLVANALIAVLVGDYARAALPLPPAYATLQSYALVGFLAPLVLILIGLFRFRQLGLGTFVSVVLSYPFAFYLDICGALYGTLDKVLGSRSWSAVARDEEESPSGAVDLRESARLGGGVHLTPQRPERASWSARLWITCAIAAFLMAVIGSPSRVIAVSERPCTVMEADDHPWIDGPDAIRHCGTQASSPHFAIRSGFARPLREDDFRTLDTSYWHAGDATFPCNEAHFRPANVTATDDGATMVLRQESFRDRALTAGALSTGEARAERFRYGRFEVELKASNVSGVISAFFLYRFDPWQEIDFEFVGQDTTQALLNVYYNPGEEGDLYNYGHLGTPVMVDLGFDAAEDFHRYAIEWDEHEIRWFADDELIHVRRSGQPTPIPQLPMVFHMNIWANCSEALAGPLDVDALPTEATFRRVVLSDWHAVPQTPLDRILSIGDVARDAWMTPR